MTSHKTSKQTDRVAGRQGGWTAPPQASRLQPVVRNRGLKNVRKPKQKK